MASGWASGMKGRARVKQGLQMKISQAQLASGSNTLHLFARMSMMEALGQLAKDGSLLAPAHKHIGAF